MKKNLLILLSILVFLLLGIGFLFFVTPKDEVILDYNTYKLNKEYRAKNIYLNNINGNINFSNLKSDSLTLNFKNFKVIDGTLQNIKNYTGKHLSFNTSVYGASVNIGADTMLISENDLKSITEWSGKSFYLPIQALSKETAIYFSKMNVKVLDLKLVEYTQEIVDIVSSNKNVEIFGAPFN